MRIIKFYPFKELRKFLLFFKHDRSQLGLVFLNIFNKIIEGDKPFDGIKNNFYKTLDGDVNPTDFEDILCVIEVLGEQETYEGSKLPKKFRYQLDIEVKFKINLSEDSIDSVKTKFSDSIHKAFKANNPDNSNHLQFTDVYFIKQAVLKFVLNKK